MTEPTRHEIIRRWHAGSSIRRIAHEPGLARHTVSRVLHQLEARRAGTASPPLRRPSRLDPFQPAIEELLGRYPELTAVRLLEEPRQRGFDGGYTIVRRRLAELRPRAAPPPVVRFETSPGAQAQMDYSTYDLDFTVEGRRRVHAFSYILGYSRRQYLRFVASQDMATTPREHVRAFEHLGGAAASCLYDNMKVVVSGHEDEVPIYHPRSLAFATHYGFRPVACRVRRPRAKGKVERPFWYVETSLFNGRTFDSLDHLNETAAWWLAHVADVRELRGFGQTPAERHRDELPHLIPLPAVAYEVAPVVYRTVGVEGTLSYGQNGYSVPWRYIGRVLPVRVGERELIIYDPGLEEVARHALLPNTTRGQRVIDPAHRPREDAQQRQAELEGRYAEPGEPGPRFLAGLLRARRYGKDQARRVLALLGTYTRPDLIAALERAVRYGADSHAAVERILAVRARPRGVPESLAAEERRLPPWLGEDPVSPRPTSEYRDLGESEPDADEDPKTIAGGAGGDGAAPEDP